MADWQFASLDSSHQRDAFCCGKASLDDFLRTLAGQYEKKNFGRTYVAVRPNDAKVYGYYTLASSAIPLHLLPAKVTKKLPKHPVPVALLGRLAVDQSAQGQGLGRELLVDALKRCLGLAKQIGIFAVEVWAIDEEAKHFYLKYGFTAFLDHDRHLFLPLKTIENSFAGNR